MAEKEGTRQEQLYGLNFCPIRECSSLSLHMGGIQTNVRMSSPERLGEVQYIDCDERVLYAVSGCSLV